MAKLRKDQEAFPKGFSRDVKMVMDHSIINLQSCNSVDEVHEYCRAAYRVNAQLSGGLFELGGPGNYFESFFISPLGYKYIIELLIKHKHVEKYETKSYGYAVLNEETNQFEPKEVTEYRLRWIEDKQHFGATIKEIFNQGYFTAEPSRKSELPMIAKAVFDIKKISPSALRDSVLHPSLVGKIKRINCTF